MLVLLLALGPGCRAPDDAPPPTTTPAPATPVPTASTASTGPTAATGRGPTGDTGPPTGPPAAEHLLLLTVDTTRHDRLSIEGAHGAPTSPHIDALLARGLRLDDHWSCSSWTMASFLCLLTARDQLTLGYWPDNDTGEGIAPYPSPDTLPSLAAHLRDQGFATGLVTANALISTNFGMTNGHDTVKRTFEAVGTADAAIERLDALVAGPDRWFLHVHFMDPHRPYDAPLERLPATMPDCPGHDLATDDGFVAFTHAYDALAPADQAACQAQLAMRYDALVAHTDAQLQRVLDALDASGAADRTAIVFATDHGEAFLEHGDWEHGHDLHVELQRSTAGLVYPPRLAPGVHTGLTAHVDLVPTLMPLLDLPVPEGATGRAVGSVDVDAVYGLVYRNDRTVQSVTTPTGRLMAHWDGELRVVDRRTDPTESDVHPTLDSLEAEALWDLLAPRVDDLAARVTDGSAPQGLP